MVRRAWCFGLGMILAANAGAAEWCAAPPDALQQLSVVEFTGEADRAYAKSLGPVLADHGHYLVVAGMPKAGRQALGGQFIESRVRRLDTRIELRGLSFDPAFEIPLAVQTACAQDKAQGENVYVLQLAAPPRDADLAQVREQGLEILQYLPHQAFLVKGTRQELDAAAALSAVRWVGAVPGMAKLPAELDWVYAKAGDKPQGGYGKNAAAPYDVAVLSAFSLDTVSAAISQRGAPSAVLATSVLPNNFFNVLRVQLAPGDLKSVAELPGVIAIDPYIAPSREDERAAQIVAGNFSGNSLNPPGYNPLTQFGVDGTDVTVAVVDDGVGIPGDNGFYVTAANTVNGPLRGATAGAQGHGHLQASIIAGTTPFGVLDPTGYNYGVGIAPRAHIVNIPLLRTGYTGTDANTVDDALATSGPNGRTANISNNSWGAGTNGNAYDSLAAQYDGFVRDASIAVTVDPLSIIFSAGNQGTSGLTRPKVAKNVISVAASENLRTEIDAGADNLQEVSSFSSRGLAADGRVKPDITAPGQAVSGGRSGPDVLFGNIDPSHRWSSGTSHAAPQVAGAAALFTQWWKSQNAGANPSPALIKAALLNGATEMTGTSTAAAIPNGVEGWGRVNLSRVLNTGVATQYVNETVALSDVGNSASFVGTVDSASAPLRVTLVWTDPPAIADPALVNNLDLEVTVGGTLYRGNVFTAGVSSTGGSADTINNVEQVLLPAGIPAGTALQVSVRATALNGDGILLNADTTDQHYALVVHNTVPASLPVIANAGATLLTGSCTPSNGAVDPNEIVTVDFALENIGTANTSNLVATLQATGGVSAPSPAQNYGALPAGGGAVTRPFSFLANGTCGGSITATLALQDGASNLGTVSVNFSLGTTSNIVSNFSNAGAITLPDFGRATPYPSTINVSGLGGTVTKVTVSLNDLSHSFADDVDVLLVGPTGASTVLMSDVGGFGGVFPVTLVLDDAAPASLPDSGPLVSGTFRPTNIGVTDSYAAPAPAGPYGTQLAAFNGANPNGPWSLYVFDDLPGDSGSIAGGWTLSITTSALTCATACGSPPTFTPAAPLSRQQGSPAGAAVAVGTASDGQTAAGSLLVAAVAGGSASGITVGAISNSNGAISAPVAAACTAASGTQRFQVTDGDTLSAIGELQVNVTPNSLPDLSYPASFLVPVNGSGNLAPTTLADNGSVSVATAGSGTFTGTFTVNPSTGEISVSNAAPSGAHTLSLLATDNCGATRSASVQVIVGAQTTTTITSHVPDPSVVGQPYAVAFTVSAASGTPTGSVSVSDGSASCGPVVLAGGSGTCNLASTSAGLKTLTATYTPNSGSFNPSSGTAPHQVNPAGTTLSVSGPPRSRINTPTTFSYSLGVAAPGAGIPSGTVQLSDGVSSCNAVVPPANGGCDLNLGNLGPRSISASFTPSGGDFLASSSAASAATLVFASADLAVTKADAVSTYRAGDLLVYTMTLRNLGPDAAPRVSFTDLLPPPLVNPRWTCTGTAGAVCPQAGGVGDINAQALILPGNGLLTYTLSANVPRPAPSTISNTASVVLPADTTVEDPVTTNQSQTDINTLQVAFNHGFEAPAIHAPGGQVAVPAALRARAADVAAVLLSLDDGLGEALRVYARTLDGRVELALAQRDRGGLWTLGPWQAVNGEPQLLWYAQAQDGAWVLVGAELR